jgi:C-terminal processing protease CtpA/Prc
MQRNGLTRQGNPQTAKNDRLGRWKYMKKPLFVFVVATFLHVAIATAGEPGWFGFGVSVKGSGFFLNPTVESVIIESVVPKSPAAQHAIAVGDEVVQVEGTSVPGRKANELKPLMKKEAGQVLHLRLKRASGEIYSANITAVKRPE